MAEAVARAIDDRPAPRRAGRHRHRQDARLPRPRDPVAAATVVVATATKALQDQLCGKDLPFLAEHLDQPVHVLARSRAGPTTCACSGRRRRSAATSSWPSTASSRRRPGASRGAAAWSSGAPKTETGDRADLPFEPSSSAWAAVSVSAASARARPGARSGEACFGERARDDAAEADVIVVNSHLYGMHLATDGRDAARARRRHLRRGPPARGRRSPTPRASSWDRRQLRRGWLAGGAGDRRRRRGSSPSSTPRATSSATRWSRISGPAAAGRSTRTSAAPSTSAASRVERALSALRADRRREQRRRGRPQAARDQGGRRSSSSDLDRGHGRAPTGTSRGSRARADTPSPPRRAGRRVRARSPRPLWAERHRRAHERHHPAKPRRRASGCPPTRPTSARRRQPVRLRHQRAALLRGPPARPAQPTGTKRRCTTSSKRSSRAAGGRTLALFTSWRAMDAAVDALQPRLEPASPSSTQARPARSPRS